MNSLILPVIAFAALMLASGPSLACGGEPCPPPPPPPTEEPEKGDNGWGNGADTTNAGSFSGGTRSSKSTNGSSRNDKNYPSALDKFTGR